MRLILEKAEIVQILGKHFEAELDPEKVIIRTEPFEIEVSGIPLSDGSSAKPDNVVPLQKSLAPRYDEPGADVALKRDDPNASVEPPPAGVDDAEVSDVGDMSPAAIIAQSREIQQQLDRKNPQLARRRGGSEKAPGDFQNEIE